jgi:hypothetical protein
VVSGQADVVSSNAPLAFLWNFSSIHHLPDDELTAEGFLELNVEDGCYHILTRCQRISGKFCYEAPEKIRGRPLNLISKKMLCGSLNCRVSAWPSFARRVADTRPSTLNNSAAREAAIPPRLVSNVGNGETSFQGR